MTVLWELSFLPFELMFILFFGDLSIHLEFGIALSSIAFSVSWESVFPYAQLGCLTGECVVAQNTLTNLALWPQ